MDACLYRLFVDLLSVNLNREIENWGEIVEQLQNRRHAYHLLLQRCVCLKDIKLHLKSTPFCTCSMYSPIKVFRVYKRLKFVQIDKELKSMGRRNKVRPGCPNSGRWTLGKFQRLCIEKAIISQMPAFKERSMLHSVRQAAATIGKYNHNTIT